MEWCNMPLSEEQVRETRIPEGKNQLKISDGGGLYLLIKPSGRYWKLAYRFDGKQKSLALGVYPAVTLHDARDKRAAAKAMLADHVDPGQIRQQEKRRQQQVAVVRESEHTDEEQAISDRIQAAPDLLQPYPINRTTQLQLEERRLHTLQIIRDANDYIANELIVQRLLDGMGHRISSDRLRTDLAWLYEQQLIHLETEEIWMIHLTRHGLDMVDGRTWIPGIRRPEPVL